MPYLTAALLTSRVGGDEVYIHLTDDDGDSVADDGVETVLLEQVDEIVNGFAQRGGYTTPLATADVSQILTFLLDIANYKAKSRGNREASEDDRKAFEVAMDVMERIALGTFKLPSFATTSQLAQFELSSPESGPFFDRVSLRSFG